MKKVITEIDGVRVYDAKYLASNDNLSDRELNDLISSKSLTWSLIVEEFRMTGDRRQIGELIAESKTNGWFDKHTITRKKQEELRELISSIYKNIYWKHKKCNDSMADMWLLNYGFKCIG